MDVEEARRLVYTRVQALDPVYVFKIMGYLLIHDVGEHEMLQLALCPDSVLHAFITKVKLELGMPSLSSFQLQQHREQELGSSAHRLSVDAGELKLSNGTGSIYADNGGTQQEVQKAGAFVPTQADEGLRFEGAGASATPLLNHPQQLYELMQQQEMINQCAKNNPEFNELLNLSAGNTYLERLMHNVSTPSPPSSSTSSSTSAANAWKTCLYFARGYCKHGMSCRFLHVQGKTTSSPPPAPTPPAPASSSDESSQDASAEAECLEQLEKELRELLSGRKAPVSIASLPQLYYEKFGKTLQADGYLTESQRHGKTGYSLTKLLAKLKSTVALLDRPHGQHAVVLAEDSHKFSGLYKGDGEDANLLPANPSSRQIYLTFPAESAFTEDDVTTHFSAYGPVQDVRIPYQQKRMFGFVTFTYSETVRIILAEGNPHYICGARVLVKPYKEKVKHLEKKQEQQAKLLQSRSFDRTRHQQTAALRYYLQDRALADEELALVVQKKLTELHLASIQKRITENLLASASAAAPPIVPPVGPSYLDTLHAQLPEERQPPLHDLPGMPLGSYGYLLDVPDQNNPAGTGELSNDETSNYASGSMEQQVLPCNIQSDQKQKFMTVPCESSPPTFFSHDIF